MITPRHLLPLLLALAACASSPPTAPSPAPLEANADPSPTPSPTPPQRGQVVAMEGDSVSEGERLELAAQDYRRALEEMFQGLQRELDQCYLPALKRDPALRGEVTVKFQVREGGKIGVGPEIADSTLRSDLVERCLLDLIAAQQYPEPFNGEYTDVQRVFHFGEF